MVEIITDKILLHNNYGNVRINLKITTMINENFMITFKCLYLLILNTGGDFEELFDPMLESASFDFDNGNIEQAQKKLKFVQESIIKVLEESFDGQLN